MESRRSGNETQSCTQESDTLSVALQDKITLKNISINKTQHHHNKHVYTPSQNRPSINADLGSFQVVCLVNHCVVLGQQYGVADEVKVDELVT